MHKLVKEGMLQSPGLKYINFSLKEHTLRSTTASDLALCDRFELGTTKPDSEKEQAANKPAMMTNN